MVKKLFLKIINFYQKIVSPNLNHHCRFYPTCSNYTILVIEKYGLLNGSWKSLRRILKCGPWCSGGIDLP